MFSQHGEVAVLATLLGGGVTEDHDGAVLAEDLLRARGQGGEERVRDVEHDQGDGPALSGP
jgi:hypothetical protein